ncbi:collagen alpha-1(XVIII) chain isoform X2 [Folsomia candida]|uniref:collagen alpha-1(XVIII) chain isoform X2 n=1 Tax=Folsomia candida TaxID=158441 RepID=UPI001605141E|nr:collagen alpha-1(XVIII) chain isoform X2 [Folsomia candida]
MKLCGVTEVVLFALVGVTIGEYKQDNKPSQSSNAVTPKKAPLPIPREQRDLNSDTNSQNGDENHMKLLPWIDLEMTLPPREEGSSDESHEVSELSLELRFDDDTPTSKMTIVDPNITWSGDGKHQITIRPMDHHPQNSNGKTPSEKQSIFSTTTETPPPKSRKEDVFMPPPPPAQICNCPDIEEIIDAVLHANILKGTKGDRGERGMNGIPGLSIQGQKGEPAIPVMPHHSMQSGSGGGSRGEQGLPGPRGPPGFCNPNCSEGAPNPNKWRNPAFEPPPSVQRPSIPSDQLYKIVPGALVFPTRMAMLQMQAHSFIGTVAFVEEEELFYGRVKSGWKSFTMGSRVHRVILTSPNYKVPPTIEKPIAKPTPPRLPSQSPSRLAWHQRPPTEAIRKSETTASLPTKAHTRRMTQNQGLNESRNSLVDKSVPLKQSRIIALNSPLSGDMGGFNQVNYQCQRQAMKTHLHGIFRVMHLLPESSILFKDEDSPVFVNLKNESLSDNSKLYSFNGKEVDRTKRFTWVTPSQKSTTGPKKQNCRGWTDSLHETGFVSLIDDALPNKSDQYLHPTMSELKSASPCDKKHVLLCVEFLHMNQIHVRHRNSGSRNRLSFDKYLAILKSYDA